MVLPTPVFLQIPPRIPMGPKPSQPQTAELFRPRLDEQMSMPYPLVKLAALIDWPEVERSFAVSFTSVCGRPALPPRLIAGLLYLQHTFDASDETVVNTWAENPYWPRRPARSRWSWIPPTADCWTRAASTWSRQRKTTDCGCARTTTGWPRAWPRSSGVICLWLKT